MAESIQLYPANHIVGTCIIPGDKSLSHRALIFAALSDGRCWIENLGINEDVLATIQILRQLGVSVKLHPDSKSALVEGIGGRFLAPSEPLNCANSGTTLRLMSGILAAQPFTSVLTGDESLLRRPMGNLAEALRRMGAEVTISSEGTPPVTIRGSQLTGVSHTLKVASAQIKSAIILAGLFAEGTTVVRESLQTRDHTERLLAHLGDPDIVEIDRLQKSVIVRGHNLPLKSFNMVIPGDASSAAYPVALASILPESSVKVPFIGLNAGRIAFFRHLQSMGANLEMEPDSRGANVTLGEPVGDITVQSAKLKNVPIDPARIPSMIDELPLLAVVSCLSDGPWSIRDAERLRVKESDRIRTTVNVIRGMGGEVEEHQDGLSGPGNQTFKGGEVTSANDHRIAMIASVAAWCSTGPSTIMNHEAVKVSFPGFFERMFELLVINWPDSETR